MFMGGKHSSSRKSSCAFSSGVHSSFLKSLEFGVLIDPDLADGVEDICCCVWHVSSCGSSVTNCPCNVHRTPWRVHLVQGPLKSQRRFPRTHLSHALRRAEILVTMTTLGQNGSMETVRALAYQGSSLRNFSRR